jgi:hypothetical protein
MQANNEKTFKCLNCGKETTSKRNNIFCSNDCYLEYRKRPNQIIKKELYAELIIRSMLYGTKHIVIDLEDAEKCKNYKWFLSFDEILNSFYVKTSKYPYSLHRVIMDCPKGFVVDHINHNTLDNRKENLRICTHAENMQNRKRVRECVNCIDLKRQNEELQKENEILKEKFEIAIKNNMDKTLLRLENGDVKEELQEIREEFGIETLYCHDDNTRVHRCLDVLRLKDALTEIKEIAETAVKCLYVTKSDDYTDGYRWLGNIILQKISECEGSDETTK